MLLIMGMFALLGGLDRMAGNRFGLGAAVALALVLTRGEGNA